MHTRSSSPAARSLFLTDLRISAFFVYAVLVSLAIVIISWHDGMRSYLLSRAAFGTGPLAVCASAHVHESIDLTDSVPLATIRDALAPVQECRAVLPRLRFDATLTAGEQGVRAVGFGIDTALEKASSPLIRYIVQGSFPAQANDIVITPLVARTLGITSGDHLNIITLTRDGEYAGRRMRVSGIAAVPLPGYDHAFFTDINGCYTLLLTDAPQFAVIDCEKNDSEAIQTIIRSHPLLANLHTHRPEDTGTLKAFKNVSIACVSICSALVLIAFLYYYAAIVLHSSPGTGQPKGREFSAIFTSAFATRISQAMSSGIASAILPLAGCVLGTLLAFILMFIVFGRGISSGIFGHFAAIPVTDVIIPVLSPSMLLIVLFPVAAFIAGIASHATIHPGWRTMGKRREHGTSD